MKFLYSALAIAFIPAMAARASELDDTLKALDDRFEKLEGYEATYEAKTSDGNIGNISIGVDFKSGWAYLLSELKDGEGNIIQKGEQWATSDGLYLIQSGDRLAVFDGFGELGKKFDGLARALAPDKKIVPSRVKPNFYLDRTGIQMGIGHSTAGVNMFSKATKLLEKDEKTARLDLSEFGIVEVELKTGLVTSQLLKSGDKTRSFKRLTYTPNPGKDAIAKKLTIKLDGVPRRNLRESGMSQKFIRQTLQKLIDQAGTHKAFSDGLGEYLKGIEDQFVTFLSSEPLNRSGFIKNDFLFPVLDKATAKTTQKLRADGKKITAVDLLTTPASREPLVRGMTELFRKKAPAQKKEQYLNEVLNGRLKGEKGDELIARILVEDFIERCYYRIRIGRGIDAYVKNLQGK